MTTTRLGSRTWGNWLAVLGGLLAGCPEDEKPNPAPADGTEDGGTSDSGGAPVYDERDCEPAAQSVLTGAGRSFGECDGPCRFELLIGPDLDACAQLALSISGAGAQDMLAMNHGALTPEGVSRARRLAGLLEGAELAPSYGCDPVCLDADTGLIFLRRQGMDSEHDYVLQDPPAVLAEAHAFLQGLIDAMASCQGSDHVTPASDCVAQP
jgi:hypothetical protein